MTIAHSASSLLVRPAALGLSALCEPILRNLPEWFGIEESNLRYLQEIEINPTILVCDGDRPVGFLSLLQHNDFSAEINIIAVHRDYHRQGGGRLLVQGAIDYLRVKGFLFLQVKTISSTKTDENYKKTREFYLGVGFVPLQEFPNLWTKSNPCLQMIMAL